MIKETVKAFRAFIQGRVFAYNRVFDPASQFTKPVLKDLAQFCRAHRSTFHPDPRVHAMLEGRREVWLRIAQHLNLTEDEIYSLHVIKETKGET